MNRKSKSEKSVKSSDSTALVHDIETKNQLITPADGTVGAILNTVTKEDVIAILVQERSDELAAKKAAGEAELHKLDASIQAVQARWPKVTSNHRKAVETNHDGKAVKALAEAGYTKLVVEVDDGSRDDNQNCFTFQVMLKVPEKNSSYPSSSYGTVRRSVSIPYDEKAFEILNETARLKREITTAQQHLLSIKREIADLPVMERRARAKLAQVSLSRDKDGLALLTELRKVKALSSASI